MKKLLMTWLLVPLYVHAQSLEGFYEDKRWQGSLGGNAFSMQNSYKTAGQQGINRVRNYFVSGIIGYTFSHYQPGTFYFSWRSLAFGDMLAEGIRYWTNRSEQGPGRHYMTHTAGEFDIGAVMHSRSSEKSFASGLRISDYLFKTDAYRSSQENRREDNLFYCLGGFGAMDILLTNKWAAHLSLGLSKAIFASDNNRNLGSTPWVSTLTTKLQHQKGWYGTMDYRLLWGTDTILSDRKLTIHLQRFSIGMGYAFSFKRQKT